MRFDPSAYVIRLHQLLFGLLLLGLGLMANRRMMWEAPRNMMIAAAAVIGVTVILLLDRHYWLLCPLGLWLRAALPIRGICPTELGCVALIGTHFVRRTIGREAHHPFHLETLWAVPYFVWTAVVFIVNPPGLNILGSATIGARFYLKLLLGFWAMIVLSQQRFDEDDCRRLFHLTIVGLVVGLFLRPVMAARAAVGAEAGTAYQFLDSFQLFSWLICRYPLTKMLRLGWPVLAAFLLWMLTAHTGKRRAVVSASAFPLLRAFILPRERRTTLIVAGVFGLTFAALLFGQGRFYDLPLSMQRGLSMFPAQWDRSIMHFKRGRDPFRRIVHGYAWEEVRRNPWLGRGGFAISLEEILWVNHSGTARTFEGHAIAGNWHNIWIGMTADLGIPAPFAWAIFALAMLRPSIRKARRCRAGSYQQTVALYCCCTAMFELLFSHTSGHSSLTPFFGWLNFGILLGIDAPGEIAIDLRTLPARSAHPQKEADAELPAPLPPDASPDGRLRPVT